MNKSPRALLIEQLNLKLVETLQKSHFPIAPTVSSYRIPYLVVHLAHEDEAVVQPVDRALRAHEQLLSGR